MTSDGDDDFGSGDDGSSSSSSPSVVAKLDDRPFLRGGRRSLGKPQGWQQPDDDSDSGGDSDGNDDDDDDSLDSAAADHEGDLESSNDSVTDDVKESDISEEDDDEHSEEDSTNERNQSSLTLGELLSSKEQKLSKENNVFLHAKERKAKARLLISERLAKFKKSERQKDNNHDDNETSDHDKDDKSSKSNYNSKLKKRKSKHAPTEVSSKRKDFYQRRRRRQTLNESGIGVEIGAHRYKPRDPRLSSLSSAPGNEDQTEQNYAFLHDIRTQETELLQKRIKARQMTGKRGTRQRHKLGLTNASTTTTTTLEDDVQKLKYLQQQKAQMERQQLERQAKRTVKKRLQQQVETGQRSANHFLNRRTMKAMYTEAKFEEIRKRGGEQAVEKALAKRRKKNKSRDAKTGLPRQRQQVHTTT